jgi:Sulfotransferase family
MAAKRGGPEAPVVRPMLTLATLEDAQRLVSAVREYLVEVREPMMLVSGLQRSGGTLLNSLLDGHPAVHSYPYELLIGKGDGWPVVELPPDLSVFLREERTGVLFREGYNKGSVEGAPTLPYLILPSLLAGLFRTLCSNGLERPRDVFDAYFTAFFNAWLDNQGLRAPGKRWITALAPRLLWGESAERFFVDYPDGRAIVPIRDPRAWYASVSRVKQEYESVRAATDFWLHGTREALAAKQTRPDQVMLVRYEVVVRHTKKSMRSIAAWLGIDWDPVLLTPTFNRLPTWTNSSFDLPGEGVKRAPIDAWRTAIRPRTAEQVMSATSELYEEACAAADMA